ncbi:MAG: 4'-phosphopantetheinyl transferase superfamily protein, partial [Bacteroidota bacterium]
MIGHDIIDLSYAHLSSRWKEKRYWDRFLTEKELNWVQIQGDPFTASQLLWAIKEASYKLVRKEKAIHQFIPKKLLINVLSDSTYYDSEYFQVDSP